MLPEVTDYSRLFLFRHPELSPEHSGIAVGSGPASVGRRGQQSVIDWLKLLEEVELKGVWCSDQPQCADPAAAIAATKGLDPVSDERLRDQSLGSWEGRSWDDIAREDAEKVRSFFADFGEVVAPEGESLGQAVERFLEWWGEVRPQALGGSIAVVTSGTLITGFVAAMLGMRLSRSVSLNLPNGGLGVLDVFDNGVRVAAWNPMALER